MSGTLLPTRRQWAIAAGFLGCLLVPLSLVGWALGGPLALAALPGVAVGFVVTLQARSTRVGLLAVAVMAGLALVSTLAAASTPVAAVWLGLVGVAYGLSGLRGWHRLTMQMAIWCAYIVVNPLQAGGETKLTRIGDVDASLSAAAVTALAVLAAGAVMAVLAGRVARRDPLPPAPVLARHRAYALAAAAGGLLALGTAVVLGTERLVAGEWLLLTVIVLLQPDTAATLRHTAERVAGTLFGVLAAAGIALALGESGVRTALALVLMVAAFAFLQVPRRYWLYVALFTPGLVLLSSPPGETEAVAAARLGFTLAGAIAVAAVALALSRFDRPSAG